MPGEHETLGCDLVGWPWPGVHLVHISQYNPSHVQGYLHSILHVHVLLKMPTTTAQRYTHSLHPPDTQLASQG
jgi:hypothetical protein